MTVSLTLRAHSVHRGRAALVWRTPGARHPSSHGRSTSPRPAHSPSGALGAELQNSKTHLLTHRARRSQLRRDGRHKHPERMPFLQRQSPKKTHVKNKTSLQRKSLKKQHSSQKKKSALTISNKDKSILVEERKRSKLIKYKRRK